MKYMVMECGLSYAVVLDEDGHFLKVANRHYEKGQIVTEVIEMQMPQATEKKKTTGKWIGSLAAMAACLILIATSVLWMEQPAYASVYMTINPEIRIDVSRNDTVVGLESLNADGGNLIKDYRYKKKDLDMVMNELADRAIDMGYLQEGGRISLTLDTDDDQWIIDHSDSLTAHLDRYLTEKMSVIIEITNTTDTTDKNVQNRQVVIPVIPSDDHYDESAYDGIADPKDGADSGEPDMQPSAAGSDDSEHTDTGGQPDYEEESDYGTGTAEDGQSPYEGHGEDDDVDDGDEDDRDDEDTENTDDDGDSEYKDREHEDHEDSGYGDDDD